MSSLLQRLVFVFVLALALIAGADEEATGPGLHAVLSDAASSVHRTDSRISFDWPSRRVDSRLGELKNARWSGKLLVRQPGKHTFHVMIAGKVTVAIDGADVLTASGDNIFHSGPAADLYAGDHEIQITYECDTSADAKLQLFWSSAEFTLEPLPADGLSHELNETLTREAAAATKAESGRILADALRCSACHSGMEELPTLKAPSLLQAGELSQTQIIERLMNPQAAHADSMMPAFGFTRDEAASVAAFLQSTVPNDAKAKNTAEKDAAEKIAIKFKPEDSDAGEKLLLTTGCVVCHAVPQFKGSLSPKSNPYHGPDLTTVGVRRSEQWLMTWLKSPEVLNADHRMPVFALSDDERRQIVSVLAKLAGEPGLDKATEEPALVNVDPARGKQLLMAANCAACHRIAGIEATEKKLVRISSQSNLAGVNSCVSASPASEADRAAKRPPRFLIEEHQRMQLQAWLKTVSTNLRPVTDSAKGELLMHRNGCLACHDRDQHRGISLLAGELESRRDDLRGQSQTLIPPALTAVGDKLQDDYLMSAVAGEQASRRLPWLLVRMPKFAFSKEDRQAIVGHFVSSDRIPEAADVARAELFEHMNPHHPSLATAGELLTGNQLIGAGGFNCIACHKAGPYEPRNVAMGTRGSDIMTMGTRIRPRYFMRWMQNPIRVVPGIEMPAIRKAIPGVLEDSLSQQIAMMWKALADPKFSPPTVVSRYEQFVTVSPGQRPHVIRDVFTIGDSKTRNSVARAMAVGFNNGHNVLIDLDTMKVRQWTIGEFARQRTEGKSWFWDMAGVTVTASPLAHLMCELTDKSSPSAAPLVAVPDERRHAELLSYRLTDGALSLRVRYYFTTETAKQESATEPERLSRHTAKTAWNDPENNLLQAIVSFTLQPTAKSGHTTGWMMTAEVQECRPNARLQFCSWQDHQLTGDGIAWTSTVRPAPVRDDAVVSLSKGEMATLTMATSVVPPSIVPPALPRTTSSPEPITSLPGFEGQRLPIDTAIMPTAMTWLDDGRLAFASLRGQIWIAKDTNDDKLLDSLSLFAEGLAAPYGIQADGDSVLVSHKPEVIRLRDSNGDGVADEFDVFASGWGFSDDYHDWTTALARDKNGNYYVGLGSDYSQNNRPADNDRWRGNVLKIDSTGAITPVAYSFRFPMGLAFDRDEHLFATDNQGVQNTFNEINHVVIGKHYGVPSRHETAKDVVAETASLMIPHPWTRSVNSIVFFPADYAVPELSGHGVGCEYDTRCLIRFTVQEVDGTLQGASYRFSRPDQPGGGGNFVGPVASAIGPDGALYIGSIWDSGWQGGTNTGTIERVVPSALIPNGIREIRATATGFDVSFFHPVDPNKATQPGLWSLQGYTRSWGGSYATPDSDRHALVPVKLELSLDQRAISITTPERKTGYVYEISVKQPLDNSEPENFWPTEGFYSLKVVPK